MNRVNLFLLLTLGLTAMYACEDSTSSLLSETPSIEPNHVVESAIAQSEDELIFNTEDWDVSSYFSQSFHVHFDPDLAQLGHASRAGAYTQTDNGAAPPRLMLRVPDH